MTSRSVEVARRFVLPTAQGRLRSVWWLAYKGLARGIGGYLRRTHPEGAAYAGGSLGFGEPVYGLSDIDVVVVVPDDPERPGANRDRVLRRWDRLRRRTSLASGLVDHLVDLDVYEDGDLREIVSSPALTYGLDRFSSTPPDGSLYAAATHSRVALHERPGLYQPMSGWRLLGGPDRRPPRPAHDGQQRRIAAWAELQHWWSWAFRACMHPSRPRTPLLSAKLLAEASRIWLWLTEGRQFVQRREALERTLRLLPEHERALRLALELHSASLAVSPAPLGELLPSFLALSSRIANRLADEIEGAGTTSVRLIRGAEAELTLPMEAAEAIRSLAGDSRESELLPLADWRARTLSHCEDAFAPIPGDPADPAVLGGAARAERDGAYAALRADGLLILPSEEPLRGRGRLRALQCDATDPVSLALAEGRETACFPNVPGWSAQDSAQRAVAEHRTWVGTHRCREEHPGLGRQLNAIRAALFLESIEDGRPELPLSMAAAVRTLGERHPQKLDIAAEAYERYRRFRLHGERPPARAAEELGEVVSSLPPYAGTHNGRARPRRARRAPAPTVSVIVAVYNEEQHIAGLLASLREQTLPPLEVIVVDDGSTDRTADVASREGANVLRRPHRGPAVARNDGARLAAGEVLVFLDGDMACAPEFVERLVAPIAEGRAIGTFSRELYLANAENRWARAYAALRGSPPDRLLPADFRERWENFRAIRRDRFLAVGGYDDVGYGEDMTVAPKVGEFALVAPGAICFHHHPSSPHEIFENARWIGRGAAIRKIPRPWHAYSPNRMIRWSVHAIRQGRTPWVLPARAVYHAGIWLGLAESSIAPRRHWK